MSAWLVTPLEPADLEAVRALGELTRAGFDPAEERARPWAKQWVARPARAAPPLGFALTWRAADEVHLLDLAVDPGARRRGIGRALLRAVLEDAERSGAALVVLEVRASNDAALALYGALGFARTGVRRAYYSDNGEDAIVMQKHLAPGDPR